MNGTTEKGGVLDTGISLRPAEKNRVRVEGGSSKRSGWTPKKQKGTIQCGKRVTIRTRGAYEDLIGGQGRQGTEGGGGVSSPNYRKRAFSWTPLNLERAYTHA